MIVTIYKYTIENNLTKKKTHKQFLASFLR